MSNLYIKAPTAGGGGGQTDSYTIFSDFFRPPGSNGSYTNGIVSANIGTVTQDYINTDKQKGHPGTVKVKTGSSQVNRGIIYGIAPNQYSLTYEEGVQCDTIFRINTFDALAKYSLGYRYGFPSASSDAYGTTAMMIIENDTVFGYANNTAFSGYEAGAITPTSYTLTAGEWYHFRVKFVSADLIEFYVYSMDGEVVWSDILTTNIPVLFYSTIISTMSLQLTMYSSAGVSGSEHMEIDYLGITFPSIQRGAGGIINFNQ